MADERSNLPDSAFENLTSNEKKKFTEVLENIAPGLKSKIIDTIKNAPTTSKSMHDKVTTTTTHEKDWF